MYDSLIRRDPRDGQTIIPDLAQRWEISPDGKKYTFHLRRGVKFHDGADFTAEDVKATYERIASPPKGVVIPRTPLFSGVSDIVVLDPYRIEFRLKEARPPPFMLGAFASGWNIIRRPIHLALDRHALVDVVKDVAPMLVGGFVYPFHELSTPAAELVSKRLGYQKDTRPAVQEAKKLMAEAGHAGGIKNLTFLVRDAATFKLWSVAIQAMLKETLNIETNLRTVQISQWFEDAAAGNFDLGISAIVSTLMDPSDYFSAWYGKDGPQHYSNWTNPAFHDLASQIEREVDDGRRKTMVRQAEEILEKDPPLLPVSYEKIYDAWHNKVPGQNPSTSFGIYY